MRKRFGIIAVLLLIGIHTSLPLAAAAAPVKNVVVNTEYYKGIEELKYPQVKQVGDVSFERQINKDFDTYIKKSYKAFKDNIEAAEEYNYEPAYQSDFNVEYNQDKKLSIVTSNYIFTGGAHGATVVESFNYDLKAKKRVRLTDILTTKQQLDRVTTYVYKFARANPNVFYPDIKKEDIKLDKNTAFYYTKDGIALVFQQYEIAPYVSGNQVIKIPKEVYEK